MSGCAIAVGFPIFSQFLQHIFPVHPDSAKIHGSYFNLRHPVFQIKIRAKRKPDPVRFETMRTKVKTDSYYSCISLTPPLMTHLASSTFTNK